MPKITALESIDAALATAMAVELIIIAPQSSLRVSVRDVFTKEDVRLLRSVASRIDSDAAFGAEVEAADVFRSIANRLEGLLSLPAPR